MIEQINIQNFQSHKNSTLKFTPGVNSIIGQSDSGKSTILRALYWCLYGKPQGDSIKSNWGGVTAVLVDFNDGFRVSKQRDKTNTYQLGQFDLFDKENAPQEMEFKAIGSGVPEEIQKAINMGELNFQSQMDAPFFLSLTPGEAARQLNEIVHLEIIDRSISNGNRMVRELKQKESFVKEEIDAKENELERTKYIQKTYKLIKEAEEKDKEIIDLRNKASGICGLINIITSINSELSGYSYIKEVDFTIAEKGISQMESVEGELQDLSDLILSIESNSNELSEYEYVRGIDLALSDKLLEESNKARESIFNLSNLICDIENNEVALESINSKINSLEKQYRKEFPKVCPLCGK